MKKIYALLICLMACSAVFAQSITPIQTAIGDKTDGYFYRGSQREGLDHLHYLYFSDQEKGTKTHEIDWLLAIDGDQNTLHKTILKRPKDYMLITKCPSKEGMLGYYAIDNEKEKKVSVCRLFLSNEEKETAWNPTPVTTFQYEKKDKIQQISAVSPDQSKMAIFFVLVQKDGSLKGSHIMVVDNKGELLWDTEPDFQFSNRTFGCTSFSIDNNGIVYASFYSYSNEGSKNKQEDKIFSVYEFTESNVIVTNVAIEYPITQGDALISRSGKLYFGGFCSSKLRENEHIAYLISYDPATQQTTTSFKAFPDDYKEHFPASPLVGAAPNQQHSVITHGIYEYANGTIAVLGELKASLTIRDANGISTTYFFAKHLPLAMANSNGEIESLKMLEKKQMGTASVTVGCQPFFQNDKLYITYRDDIKNLTVDSDPKPYKKALYLTKGGETQVCVMVESDGSFTKHKMNNFKETKKAIGSVLFIEPDGFIVSDIDKNTNISKLTMDM